MTALRFPRRAPHIVLSPGEWAAAGAAMVVLGGLGLCFGTIEIAAFFNGYFLPHLTVNGVFNGLIHWHSHVGTPRNAFDPQIRRVLPGAFFMYLAVLILLTVAAAAAGGIGYLAITAPDHGERERLYRHRRGTLRPFQIRRAYPPVHDSIKLGTPIYGTHPIYVPPTDSIGMLMPSGSAKSGVLIDYILQAQGPVFATSSGPELANATALLRETQTGMPSLVFDPVQISNSPNMVRWNFLGGCEDPEVATRRAAALMEGVATFMNRPGDDEIENVGKIMLRMVMHACALDKASVKEMRQWISDPYNSEVREILEQSPHGRVWLQDLELLKVRDAASVATILIGVKTAFDFLALPRIVDSLTTHGNEGFDAEQFIRSGGTFYIVGGNSSATPTMPLTTALVADVISAASKVAESRPGGKMDPALRIVLDDAMDITPNNGLEDSIRAGGRLGIQYIWAAPGIGHMLRGVGPNRTQGYQSSTSIMLYGGGFNEPAGFYDNLADLTGKVALAEASDSQNTSGHVSVSTGVKWTHVYEPSELYGLHPVHDRKTGEIQWSEAVMISRRIGGILVRLIPWWKKPEAPRIRHAMAALAERSKARTPA